MKHWEILNKTIYLVFESIWKYLNCFISILQLPEWRKSDLNLNTIISKLSASYTEYIKHFDILCLSIEQIIKQWFVLPRQIPQSLNFNRIKLSQKCNNLIINIMCYYYILAP